MAVWRSQKSSTEVPAQKPSGWTEVAVKSGASRGGGAVAHIGKSIKIRGDLSGEEDLVLDGHIEGRVELSDHHLTVGPNGHIQAELAAKEITIDGRVVGNVTASERVEIGETGHLDGDVEAPRILVQEGAQLNGTVTMKARSATTQPVKHPPQPAPRRLAEPQL
jgi:cytoskeletal protein CcmA (bactofilin family)